MRSKGQQSSLWDFKLISNGGILPFLNPQHTQKFFSVAFMLEVRDVLRITVFDCPRLAPYVLNIHFKIVPSTNIFST